MHEFMMWCVILAAPHQWVKESASIFKTTLKADFQSLTYHSAIELPNHRHFPPGCSFFQRWHPCHADFHFSLFLYLLIYLFIFIFVLVCTHICVCVYMQMYLCIMFVSVVLFECVFVFTFLPCFVLTFKGAYLHVGGAGRAWPGIIMVTRMMILLMIRRRGKEW